MLKLCDGDKENNSGFQELGFVFTSWSQIIYKELTSSRVDDIIRNSSVSFFSLTAPQTTIKALSKEQSDK